MTIHRLLLLSLLAITAYASEFQFTTVSRLGGSGGDDLASCRIQSDGTIVLAGSLSADAPLDPAPAGTGPGCLLRLSPDGRSVLGGTRLNAAIADMDIDESDNIYLVSAGSLVKLPPAGGKPLWVKPVGGASRVDVAHDGHAAVLAGRSVHLFDPAGTALTVIEGPRPTYDCCVDGITKTVILAMWRQANAFDGKRTNPVQIAGVRGYGYDGVEKWKAYDWSTSPDSDRFINAPTNNMADTRAYCCDIGRDNKLYVAFEAAGGNHIFRYDPQDINAKVGMAGGDRYHSFMNSRAEHKTVVARLDPATGGYLKAQEFCSRLSSGRASAVRVKGGDITADAYGRCYLVGASAAGLPLSMDPPPVSGGYTGGGFLWIMGPDMSTREFCIRIQPGKTQPRGVHARTFQGMVHCVYAGGEVQPDRPLYTLASLHDEPMGIDAFFAVARRAVTTPPPADALQPGTVGEPATPRTAEADEPGGAAATAPGQLQADAVDPATVAAWESKLQTLLAERLASGPLPGPQNLRLTAIDDANTLTMGAKGVQMQRKWKYLRAGDKADLATAAVRKHNAGDHAIAAFFCILNEDERAAAQHLDKAGEHADAVRAAFAGKTP